MSIQRDHRGARRCAFAFAFAVLSAPAALPALAQTATLAELAAYDGADRMQRLIAGAKKEGVINIYSSITVDDMKIISAGFEKKYGVKLQAWRASSETILQRTTIEARGGRYEVDAIETSAAEMETLHREKMLQEVKSPHLADIVPAAIRPHREWIGDRLNIISAGYNTNLVKKADAPKSYQDLLDPKWKGKLTIEADDAVWFGAVVTAMGEDKGLKYFRDLVRTNGLSLRKGHTLIANLVVSQEVPYALTVYHYKAEQLKRSGAPIEWQVLAPGIARFLGTGVLKRAPHPHAAVLFFDFMMHDAQAMLIDHDFTPTNMKVKPLDAPYHLVDPALVLDQGQKWSKLYDEIVVKGSR
ncbi:MAG: iron(III) transport system substrate-binding protein [Alphaproteobacteria bacterium]|nr:iron(III) transport system substrate-binding protein [Alphaproteobacteria bacterium]